MTMPGIPKAGACIASSNVISRAGRVRWMVRESSQAEADNGWRIFSAIDDEAYLADPNNLQVVDYNEICAIEPLLVAIYDFPVGSDLQIVDDGETKKIVQTATGEEVPPEVYFQPRPGA